MTNFPDKALLEEVAAEMEEREQRKQELQERKDAVKREYLQAVPIGGNGMDFTMLHTARSLRGAVDRKKYDSIPGVLDKAVLPAGHTFGINLCEMESDSLGDWSEPFILTPGGKRDESIFKYFRFADSCTGAWQAFLLLQMWLYLPLWWHANYDHLYGMPTANGFYRLYTQDLPQHFRSLWDVPNLLLQKPTALRFTATAKVRFASKDDNQ